MSSFDYLLVGGGLQSGLLALAIRFRQPDATLAIVERDVRLGGNHTWCFHDADVDPDSRDWLDALVTYRWAGYDVVFPAGTKTLDEPYSCVTSERFHEVVSASVERAQGSELLLGHSASEVRPDGVVLDSGRELSATLVVDARGPSPLSAPAPAGYQKFIGLELELTRPHGLERPVLMDATVDQTNGYRFFYLLPMTERRVLVEDTYFHDSPSLDRDVLVDEIAAYAERRDWTVAETVREEHGVLPMPWSGSFHAQRGGALRAGYRGGWFHPGTGYSFPVALRLAEFVAGRKPADFFGPAFAAFSKQHERQVQIAQFLNRLMFRWYPPHRRRSIFERFYRLPIDTVRNFYALRLNRRDVRRLLVGRPPAGLSLRHRSSSRI